MPRYVNQEGTYTGRLTSWAVKYNKAKDKVAEGEGRAVIFEIGAEVDAVYNAARKEFESLGEVQSATGRLIIIKKDGTANKSQLDSICEALGIKPKKLGELNDPAAPFGDRTIQFKIEKEVSEKNGKEYFKIEWMNAPRVIEPVSEADFLEMENIFAKSDYTPPESEEIPEAAEATADSEEPWNKQ